MDEEPTWLSYLNIEVDSGWDGGEGEMWVDLSPGGQKPSPRRARRSKLRCDGDVFLLWKRCRKRDARISI